RWGTHGRGSSRKSAKKAIWCQRSALSADTALTPSLDRSFPLLRAARGTTRYATLSCTGDPKQTKALLRLLVKDLRVNGRSEILPTYRVINDAACALPSSVGAAGIEARSPAFGG